MTSVGVNYNFTASETGVSVWATDDKLAGRVDMENKVLIEERGYLRLESGLDSRQQNFFNIASYAVEHHRVGILLGKTMHRLHKFVVLRGYDYGVNAHRLPAVSVIFDCDLTLGIGAQIRHLDTLPANP